MLEKVKRLTKIEIVNDFKMIQIGEAEVIVEDGVDIASTVKTRCLCAGDDVSGESEEIKSLVELLR